MKKTDFRFSLTVIVIITCCVVFLTLNLLAQSSVENNTNRPGYDLKSFALSAPNYQLCLAECVRNNQCKAWVYVHPGVQSQYAMCWLKYEVPNAQHANYAISGVIKTASSLANCDVVPNGDQGTQNEFSVRMAAWHVNEGSRFLPACAYNNQQWQNCTTADGHFSRASSLLTEVLNYAVGRERCLRCNLDYAIQVADALDAAGKELVRRSYMNRAYETTAFTLRQWRNLRLCPEKTTTADISNTVRYYVINIAGHGWVPHWGGGSYEWNGDNDEVLTVPAGKSFAAIIDDLKNRLTSGCCGGIWGTPGQITKPSCWDNGPNITIVQGPYDRLGDANAKVIRNTWQRITDKGPNLNQLHQMFGCPR